MVLVLEVLPPLLSTRWAEDAVSFGTDDTLINVTKLPLPATASASPMGQTKRMLMEKDLP